MHLKNQTSNLRCLVLFTISLILAVSTLAQPVVSNLTTSVYAVVTDPMSISFAADGSLYVGRDNSGSGGGSGDAVKIHRVAPGGASVAEFGNAAIPDPDAVIVDQAGLVSGTPGSVLVGGVVSGSLGRVSRIAPDGTVSDLFGTSANYNNPSGFAFDAQARLYFTAYGSGRVYRSDGSAPVQIISLSQANQLAVDAVGRLAVNADGSTALRLYTLDGGLISASFATVKSGTPIARAPGGLYGTNLIALGSAGQLLRVDVDGAVTQLGYGFNNVRALAAGPDGALYASDFAADRIYRFGVPQVPGAETTIYARVTDPVRLSFAPDGHLFVGRDNTGSGGDYDDAVKIHRIGPQGSPVQEYGNAAITDPDAVFYDTTGQFSGTAGAVIVAGTQLNSLFGKIVKIRPDGTITTIYGPTSFGFNPNLFVLDEVGGRLLFSDDVGGKVWAMTNSTPLPLFNLASAFPLAVDALGRIVAGANNTALRLYSAEGALLNAAFAQAQTNSILTRGPGGFWGNDVYFIGTNWNLMRVDTSGLVSRAGISFGGVVGFAFGPDGALYASQHNNDLIWRIAPNVPSLSILRTTTNTVVVSWPSPSTGWTLQQNLQVHTTNWTIPPQSVNDDGTNRFILVSPPPGQCFYRLHKP